MHTAHVPAGDGPFPAILALHGWGANAHDLLGLAPLLHGGEALVLCPQGPLAFEIQPGFHGFGWFPIGRGDPPEPGAFDRAVANVDGFLQSALAAYPVDLRKLVVMGFSQGGAMAYSLALQNPARFAGLVALSSWLPEPLEAGLPSAAELADLPTLVVHGTKDPMVPVDLAQAARDKLVARGLPVVYREYEMAHEIAPEALRGLVEWLEDKVLSPIQLVS